MAWLLSLLLLVRSRLERPGEGEVVSVVGVVVVSFSIDYRFDLNVTEKYIVSRLLILSIVLITR